MNDPQAQEARIELERGLQMTKQDILDFIADLMTGDSHDKKCQKRLIDNLVKRVIARWFLWRGYYVEMQSEFLLRRSRSRGERITASERACRA